MSRTCSIAIRKFTPMYAIIVINLLMFSIHSSARIRHSVSTPAVPADSVEVPELSDEVREAPGRAPGSRSLQDNPKILCKRAR